jgi:DNA-binding transcriptional MerR regulator
MGKFISSIEITKKYNISYQALNYYTNLGLLEIVTKKGNRRFYDENKLKRNLEKIQSMKNEGYPLALIRKKLLI